MSLTGWRLILFVADVLHPIDVLAVERLLGRYVDHAGGRRRAMPMLFVRWNPNHVAGFDLAELAVPALHPAGAGNDEQRLAKWMGMPGGACARLEAHQTRAHPRWRRRFDDRLLPNRAGKAIGRSAPCRPRTA